MNTADGRGRADYFAGNLRPEARVSVNSQAKLKNQPLYALQHATVMTVDPP
jgi:hypothetical protein